VSELLDLICPDNVGEDRIGITVDPSSNPLLVGRTITLHFDYSAAIPVGVKKPLKLQVQPAFGSGVGYFELTFMRVVPRSYAFTLHSAGQWLILLRETGHNFWQGRLLLNVGGDKFSQTLTSRG
jgi:hypothetical protein